MKLNGKRKAFLKGGNSSCHFHICQHYALYKEKCNKADIPVVHWAIPQPIWKAMEEEKAVVERGIMTKKKGQQLLDFASVVGPCEFMRAGILEAVAKLIATNNQVHVSSVWKSSYKTGKRLRLDQTLTDQDCKISRLIRTATVVRSAVQCAVKFIKTD